MIRIDSKRNKFTYNIYHIVKSFYPGEDVEQKVDREQEALVEKLHSENTTEELKTWSILDKEQIDDTHVRLISDEVILVTYGDGTSETLYQSFAYTCELTEDGWLFTSLSAAD